MPFIQSLKLTEFTEVVETPMSVGPVQGMFIRSSDLYRDGDVTDFFHVEDVRKAAGYEIVTVRLKGVMTDICIYSPDVRIYWYDERTDEDVRRMLSKLEAREETQ